MRIVYIEERRSRDKKIADKKSKLSVGRNQRKEVDKLVGKQ